MSETVLWARECPGYIETELVDGVIIVTCYGEDEPPIEPKRVEDDLLVLYRFGPDAGVVIPDVSGVGTSLDLLVEDARAVTPVAGGGLTVHSPTVLASLQPATKVVEAIRQTNALTMEAWIAPANIVQDGPARIINLSTHYQARNLQLGQAGELYDVRLRTTQTTENGSPSLAAPYGSVTTDLTHIAYTRDPSGAARIYVNAQQSAKRQIGGDCTNWDASYRLTLANEMIGGRPWLGTYQLVAIYQRALTADEIMENYLAGASQ